MDNVLVMKVIDGGEQLLHNFLGLFLGVGSSLKKKKKKKKLINLIVPLNERATLLAKSKMK